MEEMAKRYTGEGGSTELSTAVRQSINSRQVLRCAQNGNESQLSLYLQIDIDEHIYRRNTTRLL